MTAIEVPAINTTIASAATVLSQVKRVASGSAPASANRPKTTTASPDWRIEPAIGELAVRPPDPVAARDRGRTFSRARANAYRADVLWKESIAPNIDVISNRLARWASGLP